MWRHVCRVSMVKRASITSCTLDVDRSPWGFYSQNARNSFPFTINLNYFVVRIRKRKGPPNRRPFPLQLKLDYYMQQIIFQQHSSDSQQLVEAKAAADKDNIDTAAPIFTSFDFMLFLQV